MLKLATLLRNPGEPAAESRYDDPHELKTLGYSGRVFFETTGLSGVPSPSSIIDGEMQRWVQQQIQQIDRRVQDTLDAGLEFYLSYDMLALARGLVEIKRNTLTCKGRPDSLCPGSEATLDISLQALGGMLDRWPQTSGIVLRFGDTEASRLPHLIGNDIYSPHCSRCSQLGRADRIVNLLTRAYDTVVTQRDKRLIARAWNVRPNGMHDTPELAQRIADQLPGSPDSDQLVLCFKYTQTDFWRYQPWNKASLNVGNRPVMYELQCQREFEGKGGVPNWQAGLWRDGPPEMDEATGLSRLSNEVNFAGVLAWVRGGGWGGPFVKNESWIDANVYAAPRLADDPQLSLDALAEDWLKKRLHIDNSNVVDPFKRVLERSAEAVRQAFYIGPFARQKADAWHPAADWVQDDVLDAAAAWRMIQRLRNNQLDDVVEEKARAASTIAQLRHELQVNVNDRNHPTLEPLVNTLLYAESLYETMRDLLAGLVAYRRFQKSKSAADSDMARRKLFEAQSHWNHHVQRFGGVAGVATPFREVHFWELTQDILAKIT